MSVSTTLKKPVAIELLPKKNSIHSFVRMMGAWAGADLSQERVKTLIAENEVEISNDAAWADHFIKVACVPQPMYLEVDLAKWKQFQAGLLDRNQAGDSTVPPEVLALHERYCEYRQEESDACRVLAALGHPNTEQYRKLREFFDSLGYACNAGARLFLWESELEHAQYWAPALHLWSARYPEEFEACAKVAAASGWPMESQADWSAGSWMVHTSNQQLVREMKEIAPGAVEQLGPGVWQIGLNGVNVSKQHEALVECLRWSMSDGRLPVRDETVNPFRAEVPLRKKTIMLAMVTSVQESKRHVLVPLVPVDHRQEQSVMQIVEDLMALGAHGLPFAACTEWLQKFVTPAGMEQLRKRAEALP